MIGLTRLNLDVSCRKVRAVATIVSGWFKSELGSRTEMDGNVGIEEFDALHLASRHPSL